MWVGTLTTDFILIFITLTDSFLLYCTVVKRKYCDRIKFLISNLSPEICVLKPHESERSSFFFLNLASVFM
uniref:Putative secreted protein n=1 Tax=Triatoma infestans TaxID=30076 RepID=A0A023F0R3_TRIIF